MRALLVLLLSVDAAVLAKVEAPFSGDREKGVYALGRLHDPESRDDRTRVEQAILGGASGQLRAAALRGLCDRAWPEGLSYSMTEIVVRALEDRDPAAVGAAAECLERVERSRAIKLLATELDSRRGEPYVLPLVSSAGRLGEPALRELASAAVDRLGIRVTGEAIVLDHARSRALLALAALGVDVDPTLEATKRKKDDFFADARVNAIRAAGGDAEALDALVETAETAIDAKLRREAVDLIALLPPAPRSAALPKLASRISDPDGGVRGRLVRELSRAGDPALAPLLAKATRDVFPDIRFHALTGLRDAGTISTTLRATLPPRDPDPLANAALKSLTTLPTPTPPPSPSPTPSPSPSPTPTPTPYLWRH